jgi:hypothetical protein
VDHDRGAKASFVDDSLDDMGDRLESGPHGLHQKDAVRFRQRDQGAEFFRVRRRWFLHENVLSGFDCIGSVRVMECMGRTYAVGGERLTAKATDKQALVRSNSGNNRPM